MMATARQLVHEDGANVLLMGCAGMADLRARLEAAVGVPVVDPCQAAARAAAGFARACNEPTRC
jgi:Asp/Glu/hydantoin racemase